MAPIKNYDIAQTFYYRLMTLIDEDENMKDFANRIGTTYNTLNLYMRGKSSPSIGLVVNVAKMFNVSVDWLLGRSNLK